MRVKSTRPQQTVVDRHFQIMGSDLCEWGRCLIEVRWLRQYHPGTAIDRLRAAGEYRESIARDLAYRRRGRDGLMRVWDYQRASHMGRS
jgi:hypothetical protein